jgi:hypothetical protein
MSQITDIPIIDNYLPSKTADRKNFKKGNFQNATEPTVNRMFKYIVKAMDNYKMFSNKNNEKIMILTATYT